MYIDYMNTHTETTTTTFTTSRGTRCETRKQRTFERNCTGMLGGSGLTEWLLNTETGERHELEGSFQGNSLSERLGW